MKEPTQDGQHTEESPYDDVLGNAENQEDPGISDNGAQAHNGNSEISLHESNEATTRSQHSSPLGNSLTGLNRPLDVNVLGGKLASQNRPMRISLLGGTLANLNRPLGAGLLGGTLANLNRPLGAGLLGGTLANLNRSLGAGLLGDTLASLNRPMRINLLGDALANLNLGLSVNSAPRIVRPTSVRNLIVPELSDLATQDHNIAEQWPEKDHVATTDSVSVEEKQYWLTQFDALVKDEGLRRFCRSLFASAHYSLAVQRACTYMHNTVREKSGRFDKDGADLMMSVFSPSNPLLRLNDMATISDRNEQQGYMFLLAGAMTGIRNPRAHEHDHEDSPEEALEMLVLVNHLMRILHRSSSP